MLHVRGFVDREGNGWSMEAPVDHGPSPHGHRAYLHEPRLEQVDGAAVRVASTLQVLVPYRGVSFPKPNLRSRKRNPRRIVARPLLR